MQLSRETPVPQSCCAEGHVHRHTIQGTQQIAGVKKGRKVKKSHCGPAEALRGSKRLRLPEFKTFGT